MMDFSSGFSGLTGLFGNWFGGGNNTGAFGAKRKSFFDWDDDNSMLGSSLYDTSAVSNESDLTGIKDTNSTLGNKSDLLGDTTTSENKWKDALVKAMPSALEALLGINQLDDTDASSRALKDTFRQAKNKYAFGRR